MSTKVLIYLLLLCVVGFSWSAYGASIEDINSTEIANTNDESSSSGSVITRIPKAVIRMVIQLIAQLFDSIVTFLRPIIRGGVSLIMDGLQFLASSDDTTMVRRRRSSDDTNYQKYDQQNGDGLPFILSSVFMMPFKMIFGSVRYLPINSMYEGILNALAPIGEFAKNPVVKSVTNATMIVANEAADQAWNFTKASVLPRMDHWITNMQESQALPDGVQKYLNEVQALYHFCHMMGLA